MLLFNGEDEAEEPKAPTVSKNTVENFKTSHVIV